MTHDQYLLAASAIEQHVERLLDDDAILALTKHDPHEFAFNLVAAVQIERDLSAGMPLDKAINTPRKGVVIRSSLRRFAASIRATFEEHDDHECFEFAKQRANDADSLASQF